MERLLKYSAVGLIVVLVGVLSFGLGAMRGGMGLPQVTTASSGAASQGRFTILDEAYETLRNHYVDPSAVEADPLRRAAIQGLIEALGDRELSYIPPEAFQRERSSFEGSFEGIGATVALDGGRVTIVAPIRDSPAERAGIRAGDQILQINGESAEGMPLNEAVQRIRGPRGSTVTLTLVRAGDTRPYTVEIVRDTINRDSVFVRQIPDNPGLSHVIITNFTDRTDDEIVAVMRQELANGARGIVLDLRNNPGGLLRETVSVTSQFLKDGVILKEIGRDGNERTWRTEAGGVATEVPMVILINEGSASGSEVLAGALQDYGRAVLIGTQTFGKGTVNQMFELSDQSALYIPIARWYTPLNRQIEGIGLRPDIEVTLTEEDIQAQNDRQFSRALEVLKSRI